MYGAVGEELKHAVFTHGKSSNCDDFIIFLNAVRKAFKHPRETIRIVLDNHSSHKTKLAKAEMAKLRIEPLFQPFYSPCYNSQETVWSWLKKRFKQAVIKKEWNIQTQEEFNETLLAVEKTLTV